MVVVVLGCAGVLIVVVCGTTLVALAVGAVCGC